MADKQWPESAPAASLDGQDSAKAEKPGSDKRDAWRRNLRNWQVYAAAAGAALATTGRAEADMIYSGPLNVVFTPSANDPFPIPGAGYVLQIHNANGTDVHSIRISEHLITGKELFTLDANPGPIRFQDTSFNGLWNFFPGASWPLGGHQIATNKRYVHSFERGIGRYFGGSGPHTHATGILFPNSLRQVEPGTSHPYYRFKSHPGTARHNNFGATGSVFNPGGGGYVGFEVGQGADNYGWIHLNVFQAQSGNWGLDLESWAWNTQGPALVAPQPSQTPEPASGSLAMLATGAAGLLALRRRRRQAKAASDTTR